MNVVKGKINPIRDNVLITDMEFGEERTTTGIIVRSLNGKTEGIKASNSKKYYETIKHKKSGGYLKEVLFPTGLSAATTVLGLTALQHTISKMNNKKKNKK